jgi:hypothetical protein
LEGRRKSREGCRVRIEAVGGWYNKSEARVRRRNKRYSGEEETGRNRLVEAVGLMVVVGGE